MSQDRTEFGAGGQRWYHQDFVQDDIRVTSTMVVLGQPESAARCFA